jgi:very-short-patch-repair endonuclease
MSDEIPKDQTNDKSLRKSLQSTENAIDAAIRFNVLSEIYDKTQENMGNLTKDMDDDTQNDVIKNPIDILADGMIRKPEKS